MDFAEDEANKGPMPDGSRRTAIVATETGMLHPLRTAAPEIDYRPFIIADADTGHGGDAHVRNLIRRFVEVGVPGYHIEDQKPGAKKCGHQGGKVLVPSDEQIKRLNAARFQLAQRVIAEHQREVERFVAARPRSRELTRRPPPICPGVCRCRGWPSGQARSPCT